MTRRAATRSGSRWRRTTRGPAAGSDAGNLLARIPGRGGGQHPALRPPGHGPARCAGRAGARRRRLGERQRGDPRRRQQGGGGGAARARPAADRRRGAARGRGRAAVHGLRGDRRCAGRAEFDVGRLQPLRLRVRPRHADRRDRRSPRRRTTGSWPRFRGRAAHAGIRPEAGRSAIAAAAARRSRRCGSAGSTPRRPPTSGRSTGGTRDQRRARALPASRPRSRSLDAARAEARRDRDGRPPPGRRRRRRVRPRRDRRADVQGLPDAAQGAARSRSPSGRCAPAATSRRHIVTGGGSDANAFQAAGFPCTNLANGTERNHEPTSGSASTRSRACSRSRSRSSTRPAATLRRTRRRPAR